MTALPPTLARMTLLLALAAAAPVRAQLPPTSPPPADRPADAIAAALPKLRQLVRAGIEQREPSANVLLRGGRTTLFDGSYDWHSCIAAHWAGLTMARSAGDQDLERFLLARLTPSALAAELAQLEQIDQLDRQDAAGAPPAATPQQFAPYGEAWLLLLCDELQHHVAFDAVALRSLRSAVEQRLLAALERLPFPEVAASELAPDGAFAGEHRAWLFGYLALRLCAPASDGAAARLADLVRTKVEPLRSRLAQLRERRDGDFFDVGGLAAMAAALERAPTAPTLAWDRPATPLPATATLRTVPAVGACIAETWPLALAAPRDAAMQAAFVQRTAAILQRTDLWAEDFQSGSHWLPQFLWFGIWLAQDRGPATAVARPATARPAMRRLLAIGATAPAFAMQDLAGNAVDLASLRGKVVVLDFWATWCGPCKAALPHTQALAAHYRDAGVVVVASCTNDERGKFEDWVRANAGAYPDIVFAHDPLAKAAERASAVHYGVGMIPVQFVLDRDGKVAAVVGGYTEGEVLLEAALAQAGIDVPAAILEQAAGDQQRRRERAQKAKAPPPAKPPAQPGK